MKKTNTIYKVVSMVALVCIFISTLACTSNKKYGCPNHLKINISIK